MSHPCRHGRSDGAQCAEDVVSHALRRVVLDQGNMLVGSRVVDRLGPPSLHDASHALLILDRRQQRDQGHRLAGPQLLLQFLLDGVERELALLDQQQLARSGLKDLSAQFAADGAARASDQHRVA